MKGAKFKIGQKVRVIKYGHPIWHNKTTQSLKEGLSFPVIKEDDEMIWYDINSELVGKTGVIDGESKTQGVFHYSIKGIPGKHAWYDENQLEKI